MKPLLLEFLLSHSKSPLLFFSLYKITLRMITLFLTYTFSALSTFSTGSVSSSSKSSSIRPSMAVSIWSVLLISSICTVMIAAASSPNCCFVPSYTFIVDIGHFLVQSWQHCFLIFCLVLSKGEKSWKRNNNDCCIMPNYFAFVSSSVDLASSRSIIFSNSSIWNFSIWTS